MSLYADDVMLYRIIRSQADFISLQADVDTLCIWTDENRLNFTATKCKYMVISRKRQPIVPSSPIAIKDTPLLLLRCFHIAKYLGMWITSTFNWSIQVEGTYKKARRQIGFLYRRFYKYASNPTFLRLYLHCKN